MSSYFHHISDFLALLFLCAVATYSNEDPKYYEIENNEKKLEFDNRPTPSLPDAESYVIGVKRALLPFRQLSKYLRRPVGDPRSANGLPGIQWQIPSANEIVLAAPETEKTPNHKRWDKSEADSSDNDILYPEIILIRPINISKLGAVKISNINKGLDDGIKLRKPAIEELKTTGDPSVKKNLSASAATESQKKVKIDHQIFQGNGINIKLTFSVDVGNQSKSMENSNSSVTAIKITTIKPTRKVMVEGFGAIGGSLTTATPTQSRLALSYTSATQGRISLY